MKKRIMAMAEFGIILLGILAISRPGIFITIAFASPDSYGDDIRNVYAEQWNGSQWISVKNFTTSGDSARILDSKQVNFTATVKYNITFAPDLATAFTYTKMNITIVFINGTSLSPSWDNLAMNQSTSGSSDAQFYYITFFANWTTPLPAQGCSYNCTFNYQPYY